MQVALFPPYNQPLFRHAVACDAQVSAIRSLLDAAHEASASKWAQQGAAVPLPDDRADEEQEAESEVRSRGQGGPGM